MSVHERQTLPRVGRAGPGARSAVLIGCRGGCEDARAGLGALQGIPMMATVAGGFWAWGP